MATLSLSSDTDFSGQTLIPFVTDLFFENAAETVASATFGSAQMDGDPVLLNLKVWGSAGYNGIIVSGGSVDASGWVLSGWNDFDPIAQTSEDVIVLNGGAGDDTMMGTAFRDSIDGKAGSDAMSGGDGDDFYYVDGASDTVMEAANGGRDTIVTTKSYALGADVEDLLNIEIITTSFTGTGNSLDNLMIASSTVSNRLFGLAGNDDLRTALSVGGADRLDGGTGGDAMYGGYGRTTYVVDSSLDKVYEQNAGSTLDTVETSVSYNLVANVEQLRFMESGGNINGHGNTLANTILGNASNNNINGRESADRILGYGGSDVLNGGADASADVLEGGAGRDTMYGGGGKDQFVFGTISDSGNTSDKRDTVSDFTINPASGSAYVDRIHLSGIDAKAGTPENEAFTYIGAGVAFTAEGQVRAVQVHGHTLIELNSSGTSGAESVILLLNVTAANVSQADFVL